MKGGEGLAIRTEAAPYPTLARDAEGGAEERLRRHRAERHHDTWLQPCQLCRQPHAASFLLCRVGPFVQPDFPAQLILEMLHRVGQVKRTAVDLRFFERPIEQAACRPDKWQSLDVLLLAWLLSDQLMRAWSAPAPNTVCVACFHSPQA